MSQTRTEATQRSRPSRARAGDGGRVAPVHRRVVIEGVTPEIDGGRFPVKRVVGDEVVVEADIFADGHDALACLLRYRASGEEWREVRMEPLGNDRWRGVFRVTELGRWEYTLEGRVDRFETWRRDLGERVEAGQDVKVELRIGAELVRRAADRMEGWDADASSRRADLAGEGDVGRLREYASALGDGREEIAFGPELSELMAEAADRRRATTYGRRLEVVVDRERARFSAWYEMFPRSLGPVGSGEAGAAGGAARPESAPRSAAADSEAGAAGGAAEHGTFADADSESAAGRAAAKAAEDADEAPRHGTFADAEARLPRVAAMGFDVLYLPPIHPIGETHRKGPNNRPRARPGDPGSPWAIGSAAGGHKSVHPALGTLADFERFRRKAEERGLEVALDIAFQCSPDHPWVREHPDWFRHRPDGTIQYAENPPKKYEDIYPLDFETDDWRALWRELKSVFDFWIDRGVRIFRVDNPHTKPFAFWEWCIGEIKREHPEVIFLSEAFTRPRVMHRLAKLGFTQSYTYFAWRNGKEELTRYLTELTRTEVREYFRPNLWPNTPDILTGYVQSGGRPASVARLVLAATLGASYGIYGPPFERLETTPRESGSEEYLHSEKYEIRDWSAGEDDEDGLEELIARVNRIRRENPALHANRSLRFHGTDNPDLIAYSKRAEGGAGDAGASASDPRRTGSSGRARGPARADGTILVVVNLDPHHTQSGWTDLDLRELGLEADEPFQVHDLLSDARYQWRGARNYVALNPHAIPAHVFRLGRRVRTRRGREQRA